MPHAPKERLAAGHAVNPQTHGYAQSVDGVQQRRDHTVTPPHAGAAGQRRRHEVRVARLEAAVGPDVEVNPHVGEAEERAGGEGDGSALVVWVEA